MHAQGTPDEESYDVHKWYLIFYDVQMFFLWVSTTVVGTLLLRTLKKLYFKFYLRIKKELRCIMVVQIISEALFSISLMLLCI